jgi:hypothetical protein
MERSKSFIIIFTIMILSFLIGRTIGNSNYRQLETEYKQLETDYSTLSFNQQGFFKLSTEQIQELNRGLYFLPQGTYQTGIGEEVYPGTYTFSTTSSVETKVTIGDEVYLLCADIENEHCQESYEGVYIEDQKNIIIEGASVQFNIEK